MRDGLLLRYRTETGVDGLAGDEHPFLACSFWLVSAYAARRPARRRARAVRPARAGWPTTSACSRRSTTPRHGRMVGNFPQAFSHLALVQAAFRLRAASAVVALTQARWLRRAEVPSRNRRNRCRSRWFRDRRWRALLNQRCAISARPRG